VLGLALVVMASRENRPELKRMAFACASCAAVLLFSVFTSKFDANLMSSGVFRYANVGATDTEVIYHEDGRTATVAISDTDNGRMLTITTNGKPDAAIGMRDETTVDEMTMISAAVLPMLYRPHAKTMGIIGFGSGMSTHFVLGNPEIREVDTVEIEPAMVRAARYFGEKVERAYEDKRSNIIIDDAKSYFSTNRKKYEMIMSEPSNPWVSGVAALFSEEFYRFIPEHLSEDGLFVQWIQLYEITPELVASVVKSLLPHFADIQLFQGGQADLLMVASPKKTLPKVGELAFPQAWPQAFREEMAHRGFREDLDISALYFGNKEVLEAFAGLFPSAPKNSDYFPILQLEAPKARFKAAGMTFFVEIKNADWPFLEVFTGFVPPPLEYAGLPEKMRSPYLTMRKRAKEFRRRLTEQPQTRTDQPQTEESKLELLETLLVEHLKTLGKTCHFHGDDTQGFHVLMQMARLTIPFLRAEDLDKLWLNPAWLFCQPEDLLSKEYLAFIAASAGRDYPNVLLHGENLLKNENFSKDNDLIDYVLGGTELAAFAVGNMARVEELEQQHAQNAASNNVRAMIVQAARNKMKN
jgi:spermidine synthase